MILSQFPHKIETLHRQGVYIPAPSSVVIGEEVNLNQIKGPDTVLYPGTRLHGPNLLILSGSKISAETPTTIENCAIGRSVQLKGGYFCESVFLDRVVMGSGAHARTGTLMEEESRGAHTVGLKQTVLLPFVTLGSLLNFCDILMAGGTSRQNHSEVGSGYIHFNFTPFGKSGDKATASLIGDVPNGVMLRSPRIFLGGQGGLVGPVQIGYGTVLAAGFVYRHDYGTNRLVIGEKLEPQNINFSGLRYNNVRAKVKKNFEYIGNLAALRHWYLQIRSIIAKENNDSIALYDAASKLLEKNIRERISRLEQLAESMPDSIVEQQNAQGPVDEIVNQRAFSDHWPKIKETLETLFHNGQLETPAYAFFVQKIEKNKVPDDYIATIRALDETAVRDGTQWLVSIVNATVEAGMNYFPKS